MPACTGRRSGPDAVKKLAPGFAYLAGVVVDWSWWVANSDPTWGAVLFGWMPALLWPIHALSWVWGIVVLKIATEL